MLRGETFRTEHQSRAASNDSTVQMVASATMMRHVVLAARNAGWNCSLLADITVPRLWGSLMRDPLKSAVAVRFRDVSATQLRSIADTLAWTERMAERLVLLWDALLLVRVDLLFRMDLPLPPPACNHTSLAVPFGFAKPAFKVLPNQTLVGRSHTDSKPPSVDDTIVFVPRSQVSKPPLPIVLIASRASPIFNLAATGDRAEAEDARAEATRLQHEG